MIGEGAREQGRETQREFSNRIDQKRLQGHLTPQIINRVLQSIKKTKTAKNYIKSDKISSKIKTKKLKITMNN